MRCLEIQRDDFRSVRLTEEQTLPLEDGQVRAGIDRFAFTANNISYVAFAEQIGYWRFFPAASGWGRPPVWGFADVLESRNPGIAVGQRYFGFFPLATDVVLTPEHVSQSGFVDGATHRSELPAVYNQYVNTAADPGYTADTEDLQMIYRPLFFTSFLIDDFLEDSDFFGASQVVLSSASSKTAHGLAYLLHRDRRERCRVIGLTSSGNLAFVESLGCYDQVVDYQDIESLDATRPTVFVDMAGDSDVRGRIHRHLDKQMVYSCAVGGTHWDQLRPTGDLPGAPPTFFFAPDRIQKRTQDWGGPALMQRIGGALVDYLGVAASLVTVVRGQGPAAVEAVYRDLLEGRSEPDQAHILGLSGD